VTSNDALTGPVVVVIDVPVNSSVSGQPSPPPGVRLHFPMSGFELPKHPASIKLQSAETARRDIATFVINNTLPAPALQGLRATLLQNRVGDTDGG
jgi:hypothetical protein